MVVWQGTQSRQCMLCGGMQHRPVFTELGMDIVRCLTCRHVFSAYVAPTHYDGYWGESVSESDTFYWNEAHTPMYADFCQKFLARHSGRLLDIGCGLGFFLQVMAQQAAWEAFGWETSATAVQYARHTLGLSRVVGGRLKDAGWPPGSFDVITMWDVIEHVSDPGPLLRQCHALLKTGGYCFMHTPNVRIQLPKARLKRLVRGMRPEVNYLHPHDHVHHYSAPSLRRLLQRHAFARVDFVHLRPIQSVSGSRSAVLRGLKNAWFEGARLLAFLSAGTVNLDNLFAVAYKEERA